MDHHDIAEVFMTALAEALEDHRSEPRALGSYSHGPEIPWGANVITLEPRLAIRLVPRRRGWGEGWGSGTSPPSP